MKDEKIETTTQNRNVHAVPNPRLYTYDQVVKIKLHGLIKVETFGRWVTCAKKKAKEDGKEFSPIRRRYFDDLLFERLLSLLSKTDLPTAPRKGSGNV
jgi:hypothetical protein